MNEREKNNMSKKKIEISTEEMRRIARYEITFRDVLSDAEPEEIDFPQVYHYSLEDLYAAVKTLEKKDPTVWEFGEDWFYPFAQFAEAFDLIGMLNDENGGGFGSNGKERIVPPLMDRVYFRNVWWALEHAWECSPDDMRLKDAMDLDPILSEVELYFKNKKRLERRT